MKQGRVYLFESDGEYKIDIAVDSCQCIASALFNDAYGIEHMLHDEYKEYKIPGKEKEDMNEKHIKVRCADCTYIKEYSPLGAIGNVYHCFHPDCFKVVKSWDPYEGDVSIGSRIDGMDYVEMNKIGQCKRFVNKEGT